jgi:hypothetical protein
VIIIKLAKAIRQAIKLADWYTEPDRKVPANDMKNRNFKPQSQDII